MASGDLCINRQRGFTYMGLLLGVALIGVSLSVTATVWSKEAERQRKAEAEWVLDQYERALRSYYHAAPGSLKTPPTSLRELLSDRRHLGVVRHLRRDYAVRCDSHYAAPVTYQLRPMSATVMISCPQFESPLARREFSANLISN